MESGIKGTWLALASGLLATAAIAQAQAQDARPLTAKAPATIVADGRTAVSIPISGGPNAAVGELASHPELPTLSCKGAISLPASRNTPPALIVPATMAEKTISCVVRHRGAKAKFTIATTKPPAGLYAKANPHLATSATKKIELHTFEVDEQGNPSAGSLLRVNTSVGSATMGKSGVFKVKLPRDKAPRTLVVAFTDGKSNGVSFVPVAGRTRIEAVADNNSKVRIRIAGRWFGPVTARKKKANLKIEVQPGVHDAVVRSVDKKGFAAESIADLKVPTRSRIAAVMSTDKVRASQVARVIVALADNNGRPAGIRTKLIATAKRGSLGKPEATIPGMWVIPYTGPKTKGKDTIHIQLDGDPGAGSVDLDTIIIPDSAGLVSMSGLANSYEPEEDVVAKFVVLDKHDNPVNDAKVSATLGGEAITVKTTTDGYSLHGKIPGRLPKSRELALVVTAGDVTERVVLKTEALTAVKAELRVTPLGRNARVQVTGYDRHGNEVPVATLKLSAKGASVGELREGVNGPEFLVKAGDSSRIGELSVHGGDAALTTAKLQFSTPPGAISLGAYAAGGFGTNTGVLAEPRVAGGLGLQRFGSLIDLTFQFGVESFAFQDSSTMDLAGAPREVSRSILALEFPALLRARLRLGKRFGVSLGAAFVATRARVEIESDFQPPTGYTELVLGGRGMFATDAQVGPGHLQLAVSYGQSKLSDGLIEGNLDGWIAQLGYEWWFIDLSR